MSAFDDLIPPPNRGLFRDLIPSKAPESEPVGQSEGFFNALRRGVKQVQALPDTIALTNVSGLDDSGIAKYRAHRIGQVTGEAGEQVIERTQRAAAERVATRQAEMDAIPRSAAQQDLERAEGWREKFGAWLKNPVELTASIAAESLPASVAGAAGGALVGGVPGMIAGVGLSSGLMTFSGELLSNAAARGVDLQNPDAISDWLRSDAYDKDASSALAKSVTIGAIDAASAGAAGRFIVPALKTGLLRNVAIASGKELALQAGAGAGGEVAGSLAAGQKPDPFNVFAEAVAEVASGPAEVAGNFRARSRGLRSRYRAPEREVPPSSSAFADLIPKPDTGQQLERPIETAPTQPEAVQPAVPIPVPAVETVVAPTEPARGGVPRETKVEEKEVLTERGGEQPAAPTITRETVEPKIRSAVRDKEGKVATGTPDEHHSDIRQRLYESGRLVGGLKDQKAQDSGWIFGTDRNSFVSIEDVQRHNGDVTAALIERLNAGTVAPPDAPTPPAQPAAPTAPVEPERTAVAKPVAGTVAVAGETPDAPVAETATDEIFIQAVSRPPKNTSKWPKVESKPGYEVVFKPYGEQGRGYYYKRTETKTPEPQQAEVKPEGWSDERWEIFQKQTLAARDAAAQREAKFNEDRLLRVRSGGSGVSGGRPDAREQTTGESKAGVAGVGERAQSNQPSEEGTRAKVAIEVGDTVTFPDKARPNKPATATVLRIEKLPDDAEPMAEVDWFGIKRVPVSSLTLKKKSMVAQQRADIATVKAKNAVTPAAAQSKMQTEVSSVARTEGTRPAKEIKSELIQRLEEALEKAPTEEQAVVNAIRKTGATPSLNESQFQAQKSAIKAGKQLERITIAIPGDGEFRIWNTKEAISVALKDARRLSVRATPPGTTSVGRSGDIDEQANFAIKTYGSPENAYRTVRRQAEQLAEDAPDVGPLLNALMTHTKASALDAKADRADASSREKQIRIDAGKKEIARLEKVKRKTKEHLARIEEYRKTVAAAERDKAEFDRSKLEFERQAEEARAELEPTYSTPVSDRESLRTRISVEDAQSEVNRWREGKRNAPTVEVVNDPSMKRSGSDGADMGVHGLWTQGKLVINTAFIRDAAELNQVLNHEWAHAVLSTPEGQQAVRDIVLREASTELDQLRQDYAQRDGESYADYEARLIEEFIARANEISPTVWQRILEAIRQFLARYGLVELSDEEVARALVRSFEQSGEFAATERESTKPIADILQSGEVDEAGEDYIPTEVFGVRDQVLNKTQYTETQRAKSRELAKSVFDESGLTVLDQSPDTHLQLVGTGEDNVAGRKLVTALKREIGKYGQGALELTELVQTLVLDFKDGRMDGLFGQPIRNELYSLAQGERSFRGVSLNALRGAGQDIRFIAQNIDVHLQRIWHEAYGGTEIDRVLGKVRDKFRAFFTPEVIAEIVQSNPAIAKVDGAAQIISDGLDTEFSNLTELRDFFEAVLRQKGVLSREALATARQMVEALRPRVRAASQSATAETEGTLTPDERTAVKGGKKPIWQQLVDMAARGEFNNAPLLREKARANKWKPPTDEQVARIKRLAERERELHKLTQKEVESAKGDPAKLAREQVVRDEATLPRRLPLMRQMEAEWASITRPVNFGRGIWRHRANNAAFLNELVSANLLLRISFGFKQGISAFSQFMTHIPTRAIGEAIQLHAQSKTLGQETALRKDIYNSLTGAYSAALTGFRDGMAQFVAALRGRGEVRNVDRLMSGISAIERIDAQAKLYAEQGNTGMAILMRLLGLIRLGYRIAQAMDNLHGIPSEYIDMRHQAVLELMKNGVERAAANAQADNIIASIKKEHIFALAEAKAFLEAQGEKYTARQLSEISYRIARRWAYENMRQIGLPADDFAANARQLRETLGWNEREAGTTSVGGVAGGLVAKMGKVGEKVGLPLALGRFGNAIAISINRALHFTPMGFFPQAFGENNAWFRSEMDRNQRKIEAAVGTTVGSLAFLLALSGVFVVRLKWPRDPEERDLFEAEGHRPGTLEIPHGDGSFSAISLNTGFAAFLSPYLAAGGALRDLLDEREKQQAKLNAEAAKKGVPPDEIRPMSTADMMGVALQAGYQTVLGGRTSAGAFASIADYGIPNVKKLVASQAAPLIPGLPALQEVSRMGGVVLDTKLATFTDFLLPLPSSPARRVNFLGDPSGTPDEVQRIVQVLTGGTYGPISPDEAKVRQAYSALFTTGYRPPSINPNKGFAIGNSFRPFTDSELEQYAVVRGQEFKAALGSLPPDADIKAVRAAYRTANNRALGRLGVSVKTPKLKKVRKSRSRLRSLRSRGLRSRGTRRRGLRSLRRLPRLAYAA